MAAESSVLLAVGYFEFNGQGYMVDLLEYAESPELVVEFAVYEAQKRGGEAWLRSVDGGFVGSREDAEVYASGDLKWDGCSNWSLYPGDACPVHLCGLAGVQALADLMRAVYGMAADAMNWPDCE